MPEKNGGNNKTEPTPSRNLLMSRKVAESLAKLWSKHVPPQYANSARKDSARALTVLAKTMGSTPRPSRAMKPST